MSSEAQALGASTLVRERAFVLFWRARVLSTMAFAAQAVAHGWQRRYPDLWRVERLG